MGIQALPDRTVRLIGATQVILDPPTVIKELFDNALDAHATSIAIEISRNTIDSIQVRDNGHGILPDDRSLVGLPHCTSKIRSEVDFRAVGGESLGFRGEALASMAEVSEVFAITTRVEGEATAVTLKAAPKGRMIEAGRESLPTGTTVRLTGFMQPNPVRRQVLLKNAEKTLKRLKQLLQSYAFARPHVRYSLRVVKATHDRDNWTYAPKPGGGIYDAACKIVGPACASQCKNVAIRDEDFNLEAFLPRLDGDVSKVGNLGAFVVVDARPLSSTKGTAKQIVKLFKSTLKKACLDFDTVKEPFMFLSIVCPAGSYDPNVEPSKDDVLFADPEKVIQAAQRLFDVAYSAEKGHLALGPETTCQRGGLDDAKTMAVVGDEPDAQLAQRMTTPPPTVVRNSGNDISLLPSKQISEHDAIQLSSSSCPFRSTMYGHDEDDIDLMITAAAQDIDENIEELRDAHNNVQVSNPWVFAKMNAPSNRGQLGGGLTSTPHNVGRHGFSLHQQNPKDNGLQTPDPSSPNRPPRFAPLAPSDMPRLDDGRSISSNTLPPPLLTLHPTSPNNEEPQHPGSHIIPSRTGDQVPYGIQASGTAQTGSGTPLHLIPDVRTGTKRRAYKRMQQGTNNKLFISPIKDHPPGGRVWFEHPQRVQSRQQGAHLRRPQRLRNRDGLVQRGELGDLIDDPTPLPLPPNNRDIREFVSTVRPMTNELPDIDREHGRREQPDSVRIASLAEILAQENRPPPSGCFSATGFLPASELAAMEARVGLHQKSARRRSSKRRRTSEPLVLSPCSGNGRSIGLEDVRSTKLIHNEDKISTRRQSTGVRRNSGRRRRTSILALERVPKGERIDCIMCKVSTSATAICTLAARVKVRRSLLEWAKTAVEQNDEAFVGVFDAEDTDRITTKLHALLAERISNEQMVQDLGALVKVALSVA